MPLFDFSCAKCGHVFEFLRPFGSKALPACPACGHKKTEKLIAPPAVHFKGSGFYKTDSAGKAAQKKDAPAEEKKETPQAEKTKASEKEAKKAT